jgi:hypothetical protein
VVVCDVLPLVPLIVMVRVPVVALLLSVIVMVELPAPVIEVGLKEIVVPLPCPDADSVIAEPKPPVTAVETVTCPELLLVTLMDVGDALMENPAVVPVTVRVNVAVCVIPPPMALTVMG